MCVQVTRRFRPRRLCVRFTLIAMLPVLLAAQPARAQDAGATPREIAPFDPTGYWVAVVTEDWRWRMVTPPKGDYASVPLNAQGRAVADEWNPDESANCMAYGAAGLMRMPLRLRISWADERSLRIETDHGMQTRLLHFAADAGAVDASLSPQGHSVAQWEGNPGGRFEFVVIEPELSHLAVVTTNLAPGYLRRNGVPYSESTVLTEYFDYHTDFGDEWLTVTSIVNDPVYLTEEFITSSSFKRLAEGSSWNPVPCRDDVE
jgi:hypothetical protein